MATLTLSFTAEELAALDLMAARYQVTVPVYVARQLQPFLAETVRTTATARWETRRKTLEADPTLAATVDTAGGPGRAPAVAERVVARVVAPRVVAPRRKRKGR